MTGRNRLVQARRALSPELELEHARPTSLGYETTEDIGLIRCLSHGFPTPLARWHFHEEYELHLITTTSGKAFVGDWIGPFQPGHLVLCGPRLPHNWISMDVPDGGVPERDLVIQFRHEPIAQAAAVIPELVEVLAMLERSRHGIEFFGLSERAHAHWIAVKHSRGVRRFAAFSNFLADLARCTDYRLLSNVQVQGNCDDRELELINRVVDRITADLAQPLSAGEMAANLGMSCSRFSRFFQRATGNDFTSFVNHLRINRACQLLMETDRQVTQVCFEAGFNNVANFNRRFRDVKGMTPSAYRNQANVRFGRGG